MRLVACEEPAGPLETAPRTALLDAADATSSTGFWGDDDRYYARVERAGRVDWFTLDDATALPPSAIAARATVAVPLRGVRRAIVVARSTGERPVLVWATHPKRRA